MAVKGVNLATGPADNGGSKKKADAPKAKNAADNGDPGIFTPPPFDPDLGPSFNPRFDGQFSWDLTSHNYVNLMFGLVNMFTQTLFNGFADPAPGGSNNGNGNNGNGDNGTTNNNQDAGTGNDPTSGSTNPGSGTNGDNTVGGLPPIFGSPGAGQTPTGQPGQGSPFPVPPPYDPDLGPAFNPQFDGQYSWNLTSNPYMNLLFGQVNDFQNIIYGFPTTGQSTVFGQSLNAGNNGNTTDKTDKTKTNKKSDDAGKADGKKDDQKPKKMK